jgi:hypothetical protein
MGLIHDIIDAPRRLLYAYLRIMGLGLLIIYSLWLRLWDNMQPAVRPVRDIYDNVNHKGVSLATILEQAVRVGKDSIYIRLSVLNLWGQCQGRCSIVKPVNSTTPWDRTKGSATWRNGVI